MLIASSTLTNMLENYWWYDNLPVSAVVVVFEGLGEVWGGEGGSGMGGRDQVHLNKILVRNWICASIVESDNMGQRFTSSIFTQSETFCKTNVKLEQATKERRKMLVDGNLQTLSFNIRSIKLLVVKNYKRKENIGNIDLCLYSARDIFLFNPTWDACSSIWSLHKLKIIIWDQSIQIFRRKMIENKPSGISDRIAWEYHFWHPRSVFLPIKSI